MNSIEILKLAAIIGTFITGLAGCAVIPLQNKLDASTFDVFVSYSNAFGGGVILCVGLMHMLNDANNTLSEHYAYPWAFFMAIVGYAIVYVIEDVVLNKLLKRFRVLCEVNNMGTIAHQHGAATTGHPPIADCTDGQKSGDVGDLNVPPSHNHITVEMDNSEGVQTTRCGTAVQTDDDLIHGKEAKSGKIQPTTKLESPIVQDGTLVEERHKRVSATLLAVCLLVAISFHSFFAGLSIGVMTESSSVIATLIAVIAHKGVAAFVLGQSFMRSTLNQGTVIGLLVLFAAMTPVGVALGWLISSMSRETEILSGFVVSLSAGTFIYIGSLVVKDTPDRLTPNPERKAGVWRRYALWWLGVALMAVAAIWA